MKILVTGGAGYLGCVLVGKLLDRGFGVRVVDRFMFGDEGLLAFSKDPRLQIVAGDIRNQGLMKDALSGMDAVIHLAALVGWPACEPNPKATREINLEATKDLVFLAKKGGVKRFIFASTCSNYGIVSPDDEATEETKLKPLDLYAKTKVAAEKEILSTSDKNFYVTVLRLATLFGLSPKMRFNLLINELARETALGGKLSIRNKKAWRPFTHVADAADAFLRLLLAKPEKVRGQIFNVVGENVQKGELVDLAQKTNPKVNIAVEEKGTDDLRDYRVSAAKIKRVLGWRPKWTVKEGFREMSSAVKNGAFADPYEFRYNGWFDESVFKEEYGKTQKD